MGCDIHIYREKLVDNEWVTGDQWHKEEYEGEDPYWSCDEIGDHRNYNLFSVLARVRCDEPPLISFAPRGMPLRASAEVQRQYLSWDGDGHNHSHLYLFELEELKEALSVSQIQIKGMKHRAGLAKLEASIATGNPDWNLLYPYCGWCSDEENYLPFVFHVPADFLCGKQLQEIIDGLKIIGGDMQRVVFWFDS